MASYTFRWEHPAEEVFVTGTFDNWTKSVKLEKVGDVFEKTVELAPTTKIYYKFVADNNWTTNESLPKEPDHEGNVNNFLTPDDFIKSNPSAAFISSVGPQSTTAKMAGAQLLAEKEPIPTPSDIPGGFPDTPTNELDKPIGINPLPAAPGAVNPISLQPGEPVPTSITTQDVNSNVKLDKESYEKSDALGGVDMQMPVGGKGAIPESGGLPMGIAAQDATIATVGAGATTAALAGEVPKEPKVPDVVEESHEKAGVAPPTAAAPEAVQDKSAVEEELKQTIPEAPAAAVGTADANKEQKVEDVSPEVPEEVKESMAEAGKEPEAAANTEAVEEKKQVEAELLKEVKPVPAASESKDTTTSKPAPAAAPAAASTPANGTGSKASSTTTGSAGKHTDAAAHEKKKKNRLSTMFDKLRGKDKK